VGSDGPVIWAAKPELPLHSRSPGSTPLPSSPQLDNKTAEITTSWIEICFKDVITEFSFEGL
jgi:hypothetical protein